MNIIINGGTRGIGRELALKFAGQKNNRIIVTGSNNEALQKLSSIAVNKNIFTIRIDLAHFEEEEKMFVSAVKEHFRNIDILVNNAGALILKDFIDFSQKEARHLMEVNFMGPAGMIKCLEPLMIAGSHVINISSMGGFQGSSKYSGLSYYSASKAALACLTECLAGEFSKRGIIINCLALGAVGTEMFAEAFPGIQAPVSAEEMASFIAEFAINGRKYFNGKVIPVSLSDPK
jgi:NAD(P)-dependent dehydrogenase (short-subunit alcohol dehydrogenase family)